MGDGIERSTTDLLRDAYAPAAGNEAMDDPAYTAQLALYARTQYAFYLAFQTLVVILAVAVVTALVLTVIRLAQGVDATTAVTGLGAVVGGGATAFLGKQAHGAKDRYLEAMTLFRAG
ncbi:MAG: hypothetical protein ABI083_13500 [Lapillicoccus sp.]